MPSSPGRLPADRPYAELTGGPDPSGVRYASFADAGPPAPVAPEPGVPLLRPWGAGAGGLLPEAGTGTGAGPAVGTGTVPAVPVPRGIPVL